MIAASEEAVERLRLVFCALTELIDEFPDDKGTLYDAAEAAMSVALKHDEAGSYGVFFKTVT